MTNLPESYNLIEETLIRLGVELEEDKDYFNLAEIDERILHTGEYEDIDLIVDSILATFTVGLSRDAPHKAVHLFSTGLMPQIRFLLLLLFQIGIQFSLDNMDMPPKGSWDSFFNLKGSDKGSDDEEDNDEEEKTA